MEVLSFDALFEICARLTLRELCSVALVCHKLHNVTDSERAWKYRCDSFALGVRQKSTWKATLLDWIKGVEPNVRLLTACCKVDKMCALSALAKSDNQWEAALQYLGAPTFPREDIHLVEQHGHVSREQAIVKLVLYNGDIVDAINGTRPTKKHTPHTSYWLSVGDSSLPLT